MPHQLLLNTYRCSGLIQQRPIRVPEAMPAKSTNADASTSRLKNLPLQNASVVATTSDVGREHKTGCFAALQIQEHASECWIKRYVIV
jgi:hypothetical protein